MEELIARVTDLAANRNDVRAVGIVGSRARTNHPSDQWADVDFLLYVHQPARFLERDDWLTPLGELHARWTKDAVGGSPEVLTIFAGGVDADFVLGDVEDLRSKLRGLTLLRRYPFLGGLLPKARLERIQSSAAVGAQVFGRGLRVLCDKEDLFPRLHALLGSPPATMPTMREVSEVVNEFWCLAEKTCRKIRRGEIYVALQWLHHLHGSAVLRMIEWQARLVHGARDTWHLGRFIEEWADPRAIAACRDVFPHYDASDVRRSLLRTLDLFEWLSAEVAGVMSAEGILTPGKKVAPWIRTCLDATPRES